MKSLESSIATFDAKIARLMDNFDTQLETITDVYKMLATVIFSEIGDDIKKFSSVPKLVAYDGLYPKLRQSGESKTEGRMSTHSKILLLVAFTRRNALKAKTI